MSDKFQFVMGVTTFSQTNGKLKFVDMFSK